MGCCCFLAFFRLCFAFELGFLQILPLRIVWRIADSPTSSVYDKTEEKKQKQQRHVYVHSGKSAIIRESNLGSGVYKEHNA